MDKTCFDTVAFSDYLDGLPCVSINEYEPMGKTTSKGNQDKWYLPDKKMFIKSSFFYQDRYWKDYICEELAYKLGVQLGLDVLQTSACKFSLAGKFAKRPCSVSESFLADDEVHIPMGRIIDRYYHQEFDTEFFRLSVRDKILKLLEVYKELCHLDATQYLMDTIGLDYLIGNEDRHLNNLGVVYSKSSRSFRFPPIFDNGLSLFEHDVRYAAAPLGVCVRLMEGKPFHKDLQKAYYAAKEVLQTDGLGGSLDLDGLFFPNRNAYEYLLLVCEDIGLNYFGIGGVVVEGQG